MANEWRAEVPIKIGGKDRVLRISQNDVADLEDTLGVSIITTMRDGNIGVKFVRAVIAQGLKEQVTRTPKQIGQWMGQEPDKFDYFLNMTIKAVSLALRGPSSAKRLDEVFPNDAGEDEEDEETPPKEDDDANPPPQAGTGPADSKPPTA